MEPKYYKKTFITPEFHEKRKLTFMIEDTDTSMVNGLRRMIIAETPTVAIQLVKVIVNTSYMCDEFIAHRLALIPFDCSRLPDFSEDDQTEFELNVKNTDYEEKKKTRKMVYSGDLKWISGPRLFPVDKNIPIVELGPQQHIHVECIAIKGIGKFHAKWNPTSECVFRTFAEIDINDEMVAELTDEERMEFVNKCPRGVFDYPGIGVKVTVKNVDECIFCDECLTYASDNDKRGLVTVVPKTDKFLFRIEGTGVYPTKVIVKRALEEMRKKFEFLRDELNK